jgi:hypothetical protein
VQDSRIRLFGVKGLLSDDKYCEQRVQEAEDHPAGTPRTEAQSHGLATPCVRFAAKVAPGPRNTRFRLVANLCRAGLTPAGFHQKFSVAFSFT